MPNLIVENTTNVIKYATEEVPTLTSEKIIYTDLHVLDLNNTNVTLVYTETELPEDYTGCKYCWVDNNYELNPNFYEPEIPNP